jgi:hypothetical protein
MIKNVIHKMIAITGALSIALVFCVIAAAQSNGRIDAEILDLQGQPWVGLTVEIKNEGSGQLYHLKTDARVSSPRLDWRRERTRSS